MTTVNEVNNELVISNADAAISDYLEAAPFAGTTIEQISHLFGGRFLSDNAFIYMHVCKAMLKAMAIPVTSGVKKKALGVHYGDFINMLDKMFDFSKAMDNDTVAAEVMRWESRNGSVSQRLDNTLIEKYTRNLACIEAESSIKDKIKKSSKRKNGKH